MKKLIAVILTIFLCIICLAGCGNAKQPSQSTTNTSTLQVKQTSPTTTSLEKNLISGKVVHVNDGDTVTVQTQKGTKFKVRLYGIDAPEKAQPYGPQSTGILRKLIGNQDVNIKIYNTDRYGRKVAKIYLNQQDINAEMIKIGAAWHYKYYDKSEDFARYEELEKSAKANHKGLWNKNNPTAPWEYRKAQRQGK